MPRPLDGQAVWPMILALRAAVRQGRSDGRGQSLCIDASGQAQCLAPNDPRTLIRIDDDGDWHECLALTADARDMLDLYIDVAQSGADRPLTIAHLGQSLDGFIATENGESRNLNGAANIRHLHRMRALSDAIVVGAGTVKADNPRLTTRLVDGPNPVRVVIDSARRLPSDCGLFQDGASETILICGEASSESDHTRPGRAELITVPSQDGEIDLAAALRTLRQRGLSTIFVEGGGITVSRFLAQGLLDRLQIAVAPVILGSGHPGLSVPSIPALDQALRPACRHFDMDEDVLFDCDLHQSDES